MAWDVLYFFIFHLCVCSDVKTSLMCYFDYVLFVLRFSFVPVGVS